MGRYFEIDQVRFDPDQQPDLTFDALATELGSNDSVTYDDGQMAPRKVRVTGRSLGSETRYIRIFDPDLKRYEKIKL